MAGSKLCSEMRDNGTDAEDVWKRTCSENSGVGHGCSDASGFSLLPFVFAMVITPMPAQLQKRQQAVTAGRNMTPQRPGQMQQFKASTAFGVRPPQQETPPTPEELSAARGVESMLVDQMIQEMRKTVPESEYMPASQGEKIFRQMLDSEYARILSESGSTGIADLVLAQIKGKR